MVNALFKVALIITIRDGPDFRNLSDPVALRREDLEEAKEAQATAIKTLKENLNVKKQRKSNNDEHMNHDLNLGMDVAPEIAHRLRGEIVPVEVAVPAPLGLVCPVLKIDLKEFAYFTTTDNVRIRPTIVLLRIILLANSTPLQPVVSMVANVYHHTVRQVASWLYARRSVNAKHLLKRRNMLTRHVLHLTHSQRRKSK